MTRREGSARIELDPLTRFRNRAMLRAVKRMRSFGFRELTFDVFDTARGRVPHLIGRMRRFLRDGTDPE